MHVLFVEPSFPSYQQSLTRGLAAAGARITGIGEVPAESLPGDVRKLLYGYEQVGSVVDEGALLAAVRRVQQREWVDRLEATIEAHILPAAKVREACGIPGTSVETAYLCRDKPTMKEALRRAGVPTARSAAVSRPDEALEFVDSVGFPVILKPRSAAGSAGTFRANNPGELTQAIQASGLADGASVAIEEFVEGHEGFYDTISVGGEVMHEFVSHYYPNVLESLRERWVSPQVVTTNRLDSDGYEELREMGRRVTRALGIGTSATHMEWFYGPKGLKFSEIGCRPTGQSCWDLYSAANDFDVYREWGMAIIHGHPAEQPTRAYSAGLVSLRPNRDGRITGYQGLDELQQAFGKWVIDASFPPPGTPTAPIDSGFMSGVWVRLRHPDYDTLRSMLDKIGQTVKVFAQ